MNKTKELTQYALFAAIIFILGLTPLGYIILPMAAITTVHMPVIVGSYVFSVKGGAILGGLFGLTSLIRCFLTPDATAAIMLGTSTGGFRLYNLFLIVAIIFLPRILTGVVSALVYQGVRKMSKGNTAAMGIAAFAGSMTNTVLYLGSLYLFAFDQAAVGFGMVEYTHLSFLKLLLGVVALNGVLEAVAAVVICTAVGKVLLQIVPRQAGYSH